eukprot:jgi/Chrzof1/11528/UNPLg00462.t1
MTAVVCDHQKPPNAPWLYIIIMAYSLATALVEFARVNFDASRFGFLTASWHNVPEYMIILHLLYKEDTAFKVSNPACVVRALLVDWIVKLHRALAGRPYCLSRELIISNRE